MAGGTGGSHTAAVPLDFYELLHVDADAPQEAIAEAYWHLAEELRTNRHQQPSLRAQFAVLNEAYATLVSPARRKGHDASLPHVKALRQERARMADGAKRRSRRLLLLNRQASLGPAAQGGTSTRGNGSTLATQEKETHVALAGPAHRAAYDALLSRLDQTEERRPPAQAVPSPAADAATLASQPPAPAWPRSAGSLLWAGLCAAGRLSRRFVRFAWPIVRRWSRRMAVWAWRASRFLARLAWGAMKGAIAEYKQRQRLPPPVDDESVRSRLSGGLIQHSDVQTEKGELSDLSLQPAARLIVETGPQAGEVIELLDEPVTLGADDGCTLRLGDGEGRVAAEHARIWRRRGRFIIRQLGGQPCILVDGRPIPWALLEDGDRIEIGEHVLRFQLLESSA